jgi:hypothetical protein
MNPLYPHKESLMPTRNQALNAALEIQAGAQKVAVGIPQHILDHPELDNETREILEMVAVVIPLLTSAFQMAFESAMQGEDAIDKLKDLLDKIEE